MRFTAWESGYSLLVTHPLNRFDLPFVSLSGIVDADITMTHGRIPFFIKKGFSGVIEAGTPILQVLPFKRDDWEMELKFYNQDEIVERFMDQSRTFRTENGEVYKKTMWTRRKYK